MIPTLGSNHNPCQSQPTDLHVTTSCAQMKAESVQHLCWGTLAVDYFLFWLALKVAIVTADQTTRLGLTFICQCLLWGGCLFMRQEYVKNHQGEGSRYSFHLSGCLLSVKSWNALPAHLKDWSGFNVRGAYEYTYVFIWAINAGLCPTEKQTA